MVCVVLYHVHERFSIGCKVMVCMTQCATIPRLSWYLNTETLIQNCYEFVVPQPTRLANVPSQNIPNQRTTARHVPPNTWELRIARALLIDKAYCHCDAPAAAQTRNNNYTSTLFRGQSSIISSLTSLYSKTRSMTHHNRFYGTVVTYTWKRKSGQV